MSTEAHKIAKALGLKPHEYRTKEVSGYSFDALTEYTYKYTWHPDGWENKAGKVVCKEGGLAKWLASPTGEKAVRDKVRELWCDTHPDFIRYLLCQIYKSGRMQLELMEQDCVNHIASEVARSPMGFVEDTEAEAYAAACVWLVKQKGGDR